MIDRRSLVAGSFLLTVSPAMASINGVQTSGWPSSLMMGTGRPGGAYSAFGQGWGALAQQACGVDVSYVASGGATTDILLIEQGTAQLGLASVAVADQARSGAPWTAGVRFQNFRAFFPAFPSILQIVAARGEIRRLSDLSNRRIGVGPDGASGAAALPALLSRLGATPARCVTADFLPQIRQMLAGELDACAFLAPPPEPAIQAAAQAHSLAMIGFTPEEAAQAQMTVPGLVEMVLPAGTFRNQAVPITSVGTENFAIGAAALPDSLVSALTLAALRNQRKLAACVPAVTSQPPSVALRQGEMTFHPGAAVALRRLGIDVPAKFVEA